MSQLRPRLRAPLSLFVVVLASTACAKIGEEGAASAEKGPDIVLYGYDEGVPRNAPESCKTLERVEVSIVGKDRFPEGDFRSAAKDAGGTGVSQIRKSGSEEGFHGTKYFFKGVVVKCPMKSGSAPTGAPAATGSP